MSFLKEKSLLLSFFALSLALSPIACGGGDSNNSNGNSNLSGNVNCGTVTQDLLVLDNNGGLGWTCNTDLSNNQIVSIFVFRDDGSAARGDASPSESVSWQDASYDITSSNTVVFNFGNKETIKVGDPTIISEGGGSFTLEGVCVAANSSLSFSIDGVAFNCVPHDSLFQ